MQILRYISIFFLVYSVSTFGQTLTYSGPAEGNVSSGVMVNTDDFSFLPIGGEILGKSRIMEIMENKTEPMLSYEGGPVFDNYLYVENGSTQPLDGVEIGTNFELNSFESIGYQNLWPPDPAMSVGPDHVIAAVNNRFHIYDREGNLLKNIDEGQWIGQILNTPTISDPQVIYDHHNGRWVMLWFTRNTAILEAPFVICHSDDENPLGIWYMYAINSELNGNTYAGNWGDYPKIGYDDQALYINSRQFAFSGGYNYNKIRILNSSDFYAAEGGQVSWNDIWNIRVNGDPLDVIHPFYSYDTGINTAYFVYARNQGATYYRLFKITDPITNPILTSIRLDLAPPGYGKAPPGQQLNGDAVDNFTWICKAPVLRDGLLYSAHAVRNTQHTAYSSIKYFVIDVNTNTITEQVEQGEDGYFFIQPAITVDKDHNIAITYSKSSSTTYIGAYYSTRLFTDLPGLSPSKVMREGQSTQNQTRWGDYFSAAVDPINQYDIWLFCEFAKNGNWSTWLTEIRMKPYIGPHAYAKSFTVDFGNVEVGTAPVNITVPFSNYGDADLIINSIPSPVGPFTLTNLSLPPLSTYDSLDLEFVFDPQNPTVYEELMVFDDNDPDFSGFTMKGRGFTINPAFTEYLYATTGAADTGKTVRLDRTTGSGTELGLSNFSLIRGLAIDPITNIMYGAVVGGSGTSQIVKVNAYNGDAYVLHTLPLNTMVGIAFDNLGTCYVALQNGDIYTVDLSTGNYTLLTTTIQLTSIAINPSNNQMWASPRVLVGIKDKIYTIDLTTGDETLIGQTGFGKLTNDLTFDETGTLYGVIGGTSEEGELISINTSDATGTLLGATGFTDVQGLAYTVTGGPPVSVDDDVKTIVPAVFSLEQNYPNPFNPSTTITFGVPVKANVILKVFNSLGEEISQLVNGEKPAGRYEVLFNASNLPSGVYFYQLRAGDYVDIKKMILLK